MKPIISVLFFLFIFTGTVFSQNDFKVIKVNGTILLKDRGISLETGTVFSQKEDLLFRSDDATAAVINSQRGRIVITSNNHDLSAAGSNYLPSMYNISSRGAALLNRSDISDHFSGRYVILEKEEINVNPDAFPMNKENFFFLRYTYKGEEINKMLPFRGSTFYLDKTSLLTVDGNPIPGTDNTKIKLYYHRAGESVLISEFDLIFPEMSQLKKEIEIILSECKKNAKDDIIREAGSYINEFYGKVNAEILAGWLESNFGIR